MAFVCFSIIVSKLSAQNSEAILEKANDLYQSDQFQEALNLYESIEKEGLFSKALFYNMGNTFYRLGENGKAVLYYERALVLAPNDPQIQQDLAFLKTQLSDEIIALDVFPLISFWQNLKHSLSSNLWTFLGMLFFWGGIAGFIFWILGASRKQKKIGFYSIYLIKKS